MDDVTASIYKNKILVNANLSNYNISKNSSIIFKDDHSIFNIKEVDRYFIEKTFKKLEEKNRIYIFEQSHDLSINDQIDIRYDEYEFKEYSEVLNTEGEIFEGQEFYPEKGISCWNHKTILKISEIKDNKIILSVIENGRYSEPPEKESYFINNHGARILIDHIYSKTSEVKNQSNIIKNVLNFKNYSIIEFVNNLQDHILDGTIFTQKIGLTVEQSLESRFKKDKNILIISNYLPNLKVYYLDLESDQFLNTFYKNLLTSIDLKFGELENKINKLKTNLSDQSE
jgi:hypothetical protein